MKITGVFMKKLMIVITVLGLGSISFAADDIVAKRQNMEAKAMFYATQLDDALAGLAAIKAERAKLIQDFQDSDFSRIDIKHMNAAMVGTLLDFVIPAFQTTYVDADNAGRNVQIILQIRNGNR